MKKSTKTEILWQQRVEAWRESGLKQIEWCRQNDVEANRFWYWRRKLDLLSANKDSNACHEATEENNAPSHSGFAPVAISPPISPEPEPEPELPSHLTVALPNGLSISGIDSSNLVLAGRLIEVLV